MGTRRNRNVAIDRAAQCLRDNQFRCVRCPFSVPYLGSEGPEMESKAVEGFIPDEDPETDDNSDSDHEHGDGCGCGC